DSPLKHVVYASPQIVNQARFQSRNFIRDAALACRARRQFGQWRKQLFFGSNSFAQPQRAMIAGHRAVAMTARIIELGTAAASPKTGNLIKPITAAPTRQGEVLRSDRGTPLRGRIARNRPQTGAGLLGTSENRYNPPQVWDSSGECRLRAYDCL